MDDEASQTRIALYADARGREPFAVWLEALADRAAAARIHVRIERLRLGNWGDSRSVGEGVVELRIHHGPGYRVYAARFGQETVVLLGGGSKAAQSRDISQAKARWTDFRRRSREALS